MKTTYPKIAIKEPFAIDIKEGDKYWWCSCGLSEKQPFCDGKHKTFETNMVHVEYKAEATKKVFFCGCKNSEKKPFCDGTHTKI